MDEQQDQTVYKVVVNHEEQYSIMLARHATPRGWRDAGVEGSKRECLDHVEKAWVDMRPLSLRRQMDSDVSK